MSCRSFAQAKLGPWLLGLGEEEACCVPDQPDCGVAIDKSLITVWSNSKIGEGLFSHLLGQ